MMSLVKYCLFASLMFSVPISSVSISEEVCGQEGVEMILTCTAVGGRPAPTFSWIMPDNVQFQQDDSSSLLVRLTNKIHICTNILKDDETFESVSKFTFTPSHEENEKEVSCQAINDVMDEALEDKDVLFVECEFLKHKKIIILYYNII
jgi:hypothetical protein